MRIANFAVNWMGAFKPAIVKQGEVLTLDTGRVSVGDDWHRCVASFEFDGQTVTMERFTEGIKDKRYLSSLGCWACPLDQLSADTIDLGSVTILTPAWVDTDARVYQHTARA